MAKKWGSEPMSLLLCWCIIEAYVTWRFSFYMLRPWLGRLLVGVVFFFGDRRGGWA